MSISVYIVWSTVKCIVNFSGHNAVLTVYCELCTLLCALKSIEHWIVYNVQRLCKVHGLCNVSRLCSVQGLCNVPGGRMQIVRR